MAGFETLQIAISNRGQMLGHLQQLLTGFLQSVSTLAQQQSGQQARLTQLVQSMKDLTNQLQIPGLTANPPAHLVQHYHPSLVRSVYRRL